MPPPITVNGHSSKVTITLPSSFKVVAAEAQAVTIEIEAAPEFLGIVVRDQNDQEAFSTPGLQTAWNIRID